MAIIISKKGKKAKKIERSNFEKEDYLQKYIYDNPESIPLYEIKEDIRLLIVAREFSTSSGPIDALGIDKEGNIYIIETKLFKNRDKRIVISQLLDYGASLWRSYENFDEFIRIIDDELNKNFGTNFNQKVKDFFDIGEEEISYLIENLKKNFNEGNFKFVVLMDKLSNQLKDLIIFINENSRFDIFAVEIEYYKHEDYEIIIPKLFGSEIKKHFVVSSKGTGRQWDETSFFRDAEKILNKDELEKLRELYELAKNKGVVAWGKGFTATFGMKLKKSKFQRNIFTTFSTGKTWIGIGSISQFFGKEIGEWLVNELKKIGVKIPQDKELKHLYPDFNLINLNQEQFKVFKAIIENLCQKLEDV